MRLLAFLRRHRSSSMSRGPTHRRKPPSNPMRTTSDSLLLTASVVVGPPRCWSCWAAALRWGRFPILSPYPLLYPLAGSGKRSLCAPVTSKVFIQREAQAEEPLPNHQLSMASG